ncbi:MAG: GNAT family N-acetyltransferase [Acidobacteriaceae bacterium]
MPLEMKEEVSSEVDRQPSIPVARAAAQLGTMRPAANEKLPGDGFTILHAYPPPALEAKWTECLRRTTAPAHYASPAFFLEPYFREKKPFAVLAIVGGEVVGALTGLHEHETVVSGLETRVHITVDERRDPKEALVLLLQGVEQESKSAKVVQIYSWRQLPLTPFEDAGYRKREFTGNPILDLSLGAEVLLKQCNSKRRNCIRFAMKSGLEITEATSREEFEAFYGIYEQWCTAKEIFQYPKEVEWEAFETTRNNRRYLLAKFEGEIVAGSVFRFFPGGLVEYSRNSSLPQYLRLKPNDLLVWHAIEWACENRFTRFSMGGNHRFLREFGGQTTPIHRYRLDRTFFRQHDLKDSLHDAARGAFRRLSPAHQERMMKMIGRERPEGW